jgi:hypothetical protein
MPKTRSLRLGNRAAVEFGPSVTIVALALLRAYGCNLSHRGTLTMQHSPFFRPLQPPVLVLSSLAGRGNRSIAEGILEEAPSDWQIFHESFEDFVSPDTKHKDLGHYHWIVCHAPSLLRLIYTIPFFYYRKYVLQRFFPASTTKPLHRYVQENGIRSMLCISHRSAFWASALKHHQKLKIDIWGVNTEFGESLGWRYLFWQSITGVFSPISWRRIPPGVKFVKTPIPARRDFISVQRARKTELLLVGGLWGLGPIEDLTKTLQTLPQIVLHVVCGQNRELYNRLNRYPQNSRVHLYGELPSLLTLMRRCGTIITKPGMATLLEAHAAKRKTFLFDAVPVAEDHNAEFAVRELGAEMFSLENLTQWLVTEDSEASNLNA